MQYIESVCALPENAGIPFVVLGESFGGMVAIDLTVNRLQQLEASSELRRKWRGVGMIAPGIVACELPPAPMIAILKALAYVPGMGGMAIVPVGDEEFTSKVWHPDIVAAGLVKEQDDEGAKTVAVLRADGTLNPPTPLRYTGAMKLATAYNLKIHQEAMESRMLKAFAAPNLLLLHGTCDGNISIDGSRMLLEQCRTPPARKELVELEGSYHDLLNDPATEAVIDKIKLFVLKVCAEKLDELV